jgi:predicted nucleic acid-binding protein
VILDTNALSALADGDPVLTAKLGDTAQLALPVIALGEYRFGIMASRHRKTYEAWLTEYLPLFDALPIDLHTTAHYASLRHELKRLGRPVPENDLWIGALALQHRLPVVSRDAHFAFMPGVRAVTW